MKTRLNRQDGFNIRNNVGAVADLKVKYLM